MPANKPTSRFVKLAPLVLALAAGSVRAAQEPFRIGEPFPALVLPDLDGEPRSIADWRGERLVVHVCATWSVACRVHLPGWHAATAGLRSAGALRMIGVVEEQHGDRARLFAQWNRIDWPILVDEYDLLGVASVPVTLFVDEHGIVRGFATRDRRPSEQVRAFLATEYPAPETAPVGEGRRARRGSAGRPQDPDRVVATYEQASSLAPDDGSSWFRLGVAYRARYDSPQREPADFQRAVDAWSRAAELDPGNQVWRGRLEQYGPRAAKPYAFYDWIDRARTDLGRIGEEPVPLVAEPTDAERSMPTTRFEPAGDATEPDPRGEVARDDGRLVVISPASVAVGRRAGGSVRVHLELVPGGKRVAWDDEPPVVWLERPRGWEIEAQRIEATWPVEAPPGAPRRVEVELRRTAEADAVARLAGYALYSLREGRKKTHVRLRQELDLALPELPPAAWATTGAPVAPAAPVLAFEDINPASASHGETVSLASAWAERGVVLQFVASWCEPCRDELPALQALAAGGSAPVLLVAADEGPAGLENILIVANRAKLTVPILYVPPDAVEEVTRLWPYVYLPATYIIDANGRIRVVHEGALAAETLAAGVAEVIRTAGD